MEGDVEPWGVVESQEDVMETLITVTPGLTASLHTLATSRARGRSRRAKPAPLRGEAAARTRLDPS